MIKYPVHNIDNLLSHKEWYSRLMPDATCKMQFSDDVITFPHMAIIDHSYDILHSGDIQDKIAITQFSLSGGLFDFLTPAAKYRSFK